MAAIGYLGQRQASPIGFGMVLALHAAAIGGVLLIKGPQWIGEPRVDTKVYNVKQVPPPPPEPPQPAPEQPRPQPQQLSRLDVTPPVVQPRDPVNVAPIERIVMPPGPIAGNDPTPPSGGGTTEQRIVTIPPREPIAVRNPVRTEALFDPRYAGSQQPPYPASEVRRDREGMVRLRVTVSPDGRVVSAERLSATSDAFWEVTERQALSRWRFRPATVDGRPVQSTKIVSIRFRLDG